MLSYTKNSLDLTVWRVIYKRPNMKRYITLLFTLFLALQSVTAQRVIIIGANAPKAKTDTANAGNKRLLRLYGRVYDSFTKAALDARVTLMHRDSTVVDTTRCIMWSWGTSDSYYEFSVPRKQDRFIIKAECEGYHTGYIDYDVKYLARNRDFEMPRLLLKKKMEEDDIFAEGNLDGVVVTGTKVKIAYRGDTVVYNAAAFNLPEGSMLDGLIREMPGAELKDNGDIYINGKKVDYLTLNGKDFFKGNNKVMLDNLPYYTVQNVEVYDKSSEESRWKGEEVGKKDYVMDVKLKREYNRGTLVNTEAGAGTDDRYLARIFGLYYTDHTRISAFANTNNVNEDRRPGQEGDWSPANQPQGLRSTKQVGTNIITEDQDKKVEEQFGATLTWSDADNQTRTSTERFSTDGSIFGGRESFSRQKDFRFSVSNNTTLNAPIKLRMYTSLNYSNGDLHAEDTDSTFQSAGVINRTLNQSLRKYRSLTLNNYVYWYKKLPWGDQLSLTAFVGYTKNKPSETFSQNLTEYLQTGQSDFRNRYNDTHSNSYNYVLTADYTIMLFNDWHLNPSISYRQDYRSAHNMNYRLDWLEEQKRETNRRRADVPSRPTYLPLGWLPSNTELMRVIDTDNSDHYTSLERTYLGSIQFYKELANDAGWVELNFPIRKIDQTLHYDDGVLDTIARRSNVLFEPSFSFYTWGKNYKSFYYNISVERPDFTSLMPVDDSTNPLVYTINNPNLKNSISHFLYAGTNFRNDSTAQRISISVNVNITQNSWGTRSSYNSKTGAYTYMQDNVNGNWNASTSLGFERPLGKQRLFNIVSNTEMSYNHNVDFDIVQSATAGQQQDEQPEILTSPYSKVNTTLLSERLQLKFQKDKLTLTLGGGASWRHSKGTSDNFQVINACDYDYGMTAQYTIPVLKLDVATDLKMFSRRGYNSSMMNTDDLVWNASLSRAFFKGKLTARLMAFDILHQLSSTQYNVNAQGRTETWHNCIPRYALLTLGYKFQKMPKNKKK